ncbi:MAG TPA: methylmalonyl-CoA mutase family protein [Gemmatimonadales bacterium]|nr:methylmalonyl-CoA mutase family protein [Gemmatimonadales bacterium]
MPTEGSRKGYYGPADAPGDPSLPGAFPYTRGIHPSMYRTRLWTMRQYAGYGTPEETNRRFRQLLDAGQTGLSIAFDLPTQMGFDSDHPRAEGEVGRAGVAIDTVDDLGRLFQDIPLDQVSTSMTINATAPILVAMYVVLGEERGVARARLQGTVQNDILKEFAARGTFIYPMAPSLHFATDLCCFLVGAAPGINPMSVSGYHMREAGATAPQELAFTLANALEYLRRAKAAGLAAAALAPRLSFFFAAFSDLFEEVAKFRAARRLWARVLTEQFQLDAASCKLRFHTQTGGSTLTAQQPMNNVVRVALQALAAVLGGTQSLHTNAYDEALALPTDRSAALALRTQQVLAYETGVPEVADPLGGSWYVEALTDRVEREAKTLLDDIEAAGGAAVAIERGAMQDAIARSAYRDQQAIEAGERVVVGVNRFTTPGPTPTIQAPDYSSLEAEQRARVGEARRRRDAKAVRVVATLRDAARANAPLMEIILDAVRQRVTVGEISDALREVWGDAHA